MAASRSLASLSPKLLARKGTAQPAMRSGNRSIDEAAGWVGVAEPQDDLGWNDMGEEPSSAPHLIAANEKRRTAFTLRLDAERHFKLRLASAIRDASAQILVTEALDRFLNDIPQIQSLAVQLGRAPEQA